jgi:hypothetical protein
MLLAHMVRLLPHLDTNGRLRRLRISVPLIPGLLDGMRYAMPDGLPLPQGIELRAMSRPRTKTNGRQPPRTLVRLAVKCDSAPPCCPPSSKAW